MPDFYLKYGKKWGNEVHPLQVEKWAIKNPEWVKSQGRTLAFHFEEFRKICWPKLDDHRWHRLCLEEITQNKVTVLMGPGSCVAAHTLFPNPITGKLEAVSELCRRGTRPIVMTLEGPVLAGVPFVKGREQLVTVKLSSGKRFTSTLGHLVLTESGFVAVSSLQIGQCLFSYEQFPASSISESDQQSSFQDALRSWKTTEDLKFYCRKHLNSCDAPPHPERAAFPISSPSQDDVQGHSQSFWNEDGLAGKSKHSHLRQLAFHPSTPDASPQGFQVEIGALRCSFSETIRRAVGSFSPALQFSSVSSLRLPSSELNRGVSRNCSDYEMPWPKYRVQEETVQAISDAGVQDYYDIQVPEAHHYFADGVIHHNSGKTHEASWIYLVEYWCYPEETCVLVSSTDMRGLRKRVWGEVTDLWQQGVDRFDFLGGHLLDSALAITTDNIEDIEYGERKARDMRKGIFGIPCVQGGKFVGLAKFVGIKQKRMRLIADEASMMGESFLSAFANLNKNEDFRAIVLGNPNDPIDPLGRAAEPTEGWTDDYMEPKKTRVWNTRFMSGRCVNLIGTDSPNFDFPEDQPTRYKYLISREKIAETLSFFPKDSLEYYSQCIGSMKIGTMARRVLTRKMCLENKALEKVIWKTGPHTRVYFVDASYGGDLCVGGSGDIGEDIDGKNVLQFNEPKVIPIKVSSKDQDAEYQIASFVKSELERQDIPPHCMGHDSTGRGALGTALSKVLNNSDTHPIESGGAPSERPVSADLYVTDEQTGQRRLKLCNEHYDRKVSEFWFQVRYAVESGQIRNLPEECLSDLCIRKWDRVKRDIISVEPKNRPSTDPNKAGMKQRTGKSPDHGDWAAGIVEMARRKGFIIERLGKGEAKKSDTPSWLDDLYAETQSAISSAQLQTT